MVPTTPPAAAPDDSADSVPEVTGSFSIRRFAQTTTGDLAAVGILTLSLTDPTTNGARTIVTQATLPVARFGDEATPPTPSPAQPPVSTPRQPLLGADASDASASQGCETLNLMLGPVDLDLLGMAVRLDQVNIEFIPRGTGRLGLLLCGASVIGDGVSPVERMNILNTLLDAVG